jgi:anaerobic selenocysteine-containing dehydrogenase
MARAGVKARCWAAFVQASGFTIWTRGSGSSATATQPIWAITIVQAYVMHVDRYRGLCFAARNHRNTMATRMTT